MRKRQQQQRQYTKLQAEKALKEKQQERKDIAGAASFVHTINTHSHIRMTVCVCVSSGSG